MKLGDTVVIRTRLQALIVRSLIDAGIVRTPVHSIILLRDDRHMLESGLESPLKAEGMVGRRTVLQRPSDGFARMFAAFLSTLVATRMRSAKVYCGNFAWYPFALALRCLPGYAIRSFDDGTANIQARDGSLLSNKPSAQSGFAGRVARWLFPQGPAMFARGRIERHYTIYPWADNVVPPDRLESVVVDWSSLMTRGDADQLPTSVRRIYLGTTYPELQRRNLCNTDAASVAVLRNWAELYLPHPRDESAKRAPDHIRRTPAEAIIQHFATKAPIIVAHHNSSAALPFVNHPNVTLMDLCVHERSKLEAIFGQPS